MYVYVSVTVYMYDFYLSGVRCSLVVERPFMVRWVVGLIHHRIPTATSTASQIPRLIWISSQTVINNCPSTSGWSSNKAISATQRSHSTSSPWTTAVVLRTYSMETCTVENVSFPMNHASYCSEQTDVPESTDVIMNVMPPIVFWNMVSMVAVSWCGQGFAMMVVLPCWVLMKRSVPWSNPTYQEQWGAPKPIIFGCPPPPPLEPRSLSIHLLRPWPCVSMYMICCDIEWH